MKNKEKVKKLLNLYRKNLKALEE